MKDENNGAQRYIDWNRGSPYVFRQVDFNALKSSEYLFARKFMEKKDKKIIDSLYSYLKEFFIYFNKFSTACLLGLKSSP